MKRWILLFALFAVVGVPAAMAQPGPNIVVNGSFEAPTVVGSFQTHTSGSVAIAGWKVEDGAGAIPGTGSVDHIGAYWQAAEGNQSIDLNGLSPGGLSQQLTTQRGATYLVRFAMAGNPDGPPALKTMDVKWGGTVVYSPAFMTNLSNPSGTRANMGWVYHQVLVRATAPVTELRFVSTTNGGQCPCYGPALDDVSVHLIRADEDDEDEDCVSAPSGLVSWWPGDFHYRDIADGNDGMPVGGTAFAPGKVEEAFTFDGVTGAVRAPETGDNLDGFGALTLDAWIRPNRVSAPGSLQGIVTKYDSRSADGVSYYLTEADGGRLRLAVFDTVTPAAFAFYTSNTPVLTASAPGQFTHVAGVWDGGFNDGDFHLYVNGTEVPGTLTRLDEPTDMADNETPVNIGRFESSSVSVVEPFGHFQGEIDEVEIFNRALSEAEIDSIVNAGSAGKCKPGEDDDDFDDDGERDDDDGDDDGDGIEDEFDSESANELQFSNTNTVGAGQEKAYDLSAGANTLLLTATAEVAGAVDAVDHGLTVEIYSPQGVLVAKAPAALGRVVATAVPAVPGTYEVKVRNTGSASVQYRTLRIARTAPLS